MSLDLDTELAVLIALADEERVDARLKEDRAILDAARWPCPHCDKPTGSMHAFDVHLRFQCAALGRSA